jgi:signal transduction histidine kinase
VARIEVADTGRGIRPEDLVKVFEPYFSTKETGTGLGLAIVKKVVDDHGGTIDVKSKPGEGTKFTITLPLSRKD